MSDSSSSHKFYFVRDDVWVPERATYRSAAEYESRFIDLARLICIFFMMYVHVNPGKSSGSYVTNGDAYFLGTALIDIMGRCSVPLLSLISGYLLLKGNRPLKEIAKIKALKLLIPMIFWSIMFILLRDASDYLFLGHIKDDLKFLNVWFWLSDVLGILGPTANLSLFFIRDLFISLIILYAFARYISIWMITIFTFICVITAVELNPIIFRPSILFFASIGAAISQSKFSLIDISNKKLCTMLLLALFFLKTSIAIINNVEVITYSGALDDLVNRSIVIIVAVMALRFAARWKFTAKLASLSGFSFVTFLSHTIVFGIMWKTMIFLGMRAQDPSYTIFFLTAPIVAFCVGALITKIGEGLPQGMAQVVGIVRAKRRLR